MNAGGEGSKNSANSFTTDVNNNEQIQQSDGVLENPSESMPLPSGEVLGQPQTTANNVDQALSNEDQMLEQLAEQIAAGKDPTEILEAPAAGESDEDKKEEEIEEDSIKRTENVVERTESEAETVGSILNEISEERENERGSGSENDEVSEQDDSSPAFVSPINQFDFSSLNLDFSENGALGFKLGGGEAGLSFSILSAPTQGSFYITTDGEFVFNPGSDFDYLDEGQQQNLQVIIEVRDNFGQTKQAQLNIVVQGTDDAPVVSGEFTSELSENSGSAITVSGEISISDVDDGDNPVFEDATVSGELGTLQLVDGTWTYTLDQNKAERLGENERFIDTITVTADDGTTQNIEITITGSNDKPTVTGGGVTEYIENATGISVDGNITTFDIDSPTLTEAVVTISNNYNQSQDVLQFSPLNGIEGNWE